VGGRFTEVKRKEEGRKKMGGPEGLYGRKTGEGRDPLLHKRGSRKNKWRWNARDVEGDQQRYASARESLEIKNGK